MSAVKFIAFLRGINVSGSKIIRMADLKSMLLNNGYPDVETYIQSGNLVLVSEIDNATYHADFLTSLIKTHFGYDVPTIVLKHETLRKIIEKCPFDESVHAEKGKGQVYFSLLSEDPGEASVKNLMAKSDDTDEWQMGDKVVYIRCFKGLGQSKFSNNLIEKVLKMPATTRNKATMEKMLTL